MNESSLLILKIHCGPEMLKKSCCPVCFGLCPDLCKFISCIISISSKFKSVRTEI